MIQVDQASVDFSDLCGIPFTKMTGSGNDFVCFRSADVDLARITQPDVIRAICSRNNGIGADGLVVLEPEHAGADVRIHFFNSDGTSADLCGNATLCSTALAARADMASADGMALRTGAGVIRSRVTRDRGFDEPEIELPSVRDLQVDVPGIPLSAGERRIGFARVGIPHAVVVCDQLDDVSLAQRGALLRHHAAFGPAGANVNWVARDPMGVWRYRTFERGVEGETLACGTGAVATAALLRSWGLTSADPITLTTRSGRQLTVRLGSSEDAEAARLAGEGRVVFEGRIGDLRAP